jgi:hypothetical protein
MQHFQYFGQHNIQEGDWWLMNWQSSGRNRSRSKGGKGKDRRVTWKYRHRRGEEVWIYLFLTSTLERFASSTPCSSPFTPRKKNQHLLHREPGRTPGSLRVGSRTETVYPTQGFERKSSQPVASILPATPFRAQRIILKCVLENCDTGVI